jgi:AcrR family transcriptional regulator
MINYDRDRFQGVPVAVGLRERNKQDKRERIVAAAAELFATEGFDATPAREISRRAGIGTGTLFTYVRDKRELLFLVFRADAERLLDEAEAAAAREVGVVAGLLAIFRPFLRFYATRPELSRLFLRELFFRRSDETRGMAELDRRLGRAVGGVLERGRASGTLRGDVPLPTALAAVMAQYGFWIQRWLGSGAVEDDAVEPALRAGLELLLDGLSEPRAPASGRSP